jgi:hypothetical protein
MRVSEADYVQRIADAVTPAVILTEKVHAVMRIARKVHTWLGANPEGLMGVLLARTVRNLGQALVALSTIEEALDRADKYKDPLDPDGIGRTDDAA